MAIPGEQPHIDPYANLYALAEQRIAEQNARDNRRFMRIVVPIAVAKMALFGVYLKLENDIPEPREATYSCDGFDDGILKPPTEDQLGLFWTGSPLNPEELTTDGMQPHPELEAADGTPVLVKPLGGIANQDGTIGGTLSMSPNYARTIIGVFQHDGVRWGICNIDGGVDFTATDTAGLVNGEYNLEDNSSELVFKAGGKDPLYEDGQDVAYVISHESGHAVRDEILEDGTDARSTELINQLDALYKQQLSMGLEEYRLQHSDQIANDLDGLLEQFQALDSTIASKDSKHKIKLAFEYIKQKLTEVGGLTELGIYEVDDPLHTGKELIGIDSLNGMITTASLATAPDGDAIYGLNEYVMDYPDKLDRNLLFNTDSQIKAFLEPRFLSEHIMPGNSGGHAWDNTDELFASSWALVGLVSKNHYPEIINQVPEQYRSIVAEQLDVMYELRSNLDPQSLTD